MRIACLKGKRCLLWGTAMAVLILLGLGLWLWPGGNSTLALSPEEEAWKAAHPKPVLGVYFHYPPYEVLNLDGLYVGLTADYVRLLEDRTGLRFTLVRCVNSEDAAAKFASGRVDALATIAAGRESSAENGITLPPATLFTRAYITVPAVILARKDQQADLTLEQLRNMTVGSTLPAAFTAYLRKELPQMPFSLITPQGGYIGGLRALSMGDFDALLCDMAAASHYIAAAGISNLRIAGMTGYEISYVMAVRPDMPELVSILNKALDSISPAQKQDIRERWLGLHSLPWWQSRTVRLWGLVGLGALGTVFLLTLLWIYSLRAQVAARTAELRALSEMEIQLQRAQRMEALGALAGGISHDFNNILGAIVANGEMLELFHATHPEVTKKIQAMLKAAYRGRDLVHSILRFTRREDARKSWLHLSAIVRETCCILEPSTPQGISIRVTYPEQEAFIEGNRTQLHQVVMNLAVNAIQAMGRSGTLHFFVTTSPPPLPPQCRQEGGVASLEDGSLLCTRFRGTERASKGYLTLIVQDSGPGISLPTLQQMFSPFFSTKAPTEGTGLGLAMVESIIATHQGKIQVHSRVGQGTAFRIALPLPVEKPVPGLIASD